MSQAKYRIKRISIEGFRGFTEPQSIEIDGKNAFIFGVNGQGKSSIIEAIRWGLFGSATGHDIEVRNTFYPKAECAVTVELACNEGLIKITRELRPGSLRSRSVIRDGNGDSVLEKDVLPQLARIGHQEKTQVIFAAQHATGRQAQVDITDFTRVLCFYLRLEKVPELLKSLEDLITLRLEDYRGLAQKVENKQGAIRADLQQTQRLLEVILQNPPWGEGSTPSGSDTDTRIFDLVSDAARTKGTSAPKNDASHEALARLKREIDHLGSQTVDTLQTKLQATMSRHKKAEALLVSLFQSREKSAPLRDEIDKLTIQNSEKLNGETFETLCSRLAALERSMTERGAIADLGSCAKKFSLEYGWSKCPICGADYPASGAAGSLLNRIDAETNAASEPAAAASALEDLRVRIKEISKLDQLLLTKTQALEATQRSGTDAETGLAEVLTGLARPVVLSQAQKMTEELRRDVEALTSQISDDQGDRLLWAKRVKNLEQEIIYHKYRDKIQQLKTQLTDGLSEAKNVLQRYQDLLTTTTCLRDMLLQSFNEAMNRSVPALEKMLTEVYQRLTRQPSYDQVRIISLPDQPMRRELRVASSKLPNQTFLPNVLNGQAAKALQLVPYFVFSKFQPEVMELDLLLIDDPSESFDTSHVTDLMNEFALATEHAQIFVATHEREKFESHLGTFPGRNSLVEISVESFTPLEGPKLAIK